MRCCYANGELKTNGRLPRQGCARFAPAQEMGCRAAEKTHIPDLPCGHVWATFSIEISRNPRAAVSDR
ncbi:MAG TPA: hypothetical protein VE993_17820, partial [Stellaceae bacterium]|nr:hypothetical protein [Stellaceae bacterium]